MPYISVIARLFIVALLVVAASACDEAASDVDQAAQSEPELAVETAVSGLEAPWEMVFLPDGRMLVTERPGRVRVIENGVLQPEPLAASLDVAATGEGGLLGMVLDPGFAENRTLYLYHTYSTGGGVANRVVRFRLAENRLEEQQVILDGIPGSRIHNGGRIAFGPDGKLYIGTGDASQPDLAQDRRSSAGKILRINGDGSIPADNPFPGSPVYSLGHRNVQGLAWEPGTGQLYATEHGPSNHDEVNRIEAGANYGWPQMQGNEGEGDGFTPPVIESGTGTWAPSGATFVQGDTFPAWSGQLLFAGLRSATLWRLNLDAGGDPPPLTPLLEGEYGRLRQVVQGPDGLLYVLTNNRDGRGNPDQQDDRILRIQPR